jgi:hypothetical protein
MAEVMEIIIRDAILGGLHIDAGKKHYSLHIGTQEGLLLLTHWTDGHLPLWDDGADAIKILERDGVWIEIPTYWRAQVNPGAPKSLLVAKSKEIGTAYFG